MSPEQVGSSPVHGDWRSDQFVIGALAYRLLTNVQPFYALSLIDRSVSYTHLTLPTIYSV